MNLGRTRRSGIVLLAGFACVTSAGVVLVLGLFSRDRAVVVASMALAALALVLLRVATGDRRARVPAREAAPWRGD